MDYSLVGAPLRLRPMNAQVNNKTEGLTFRCWHPKDVQQRRTNGNFFVSIVIFAINCNSFRHGISVIIYTFVP